MSNESSTIDPKGAGRTEYSKLPFRTLIAASDNAVALANPAASTALPATGVFETGKHKYARFLFGGTTTANQTFAYQVIAWQSAMTTGKTLYWIPKVVAKGVATLGATVAPAQMIAASGLLADTLTNTLATTKSTVFSPTADMVADLLVPTDGAPQMSVEVSNDSQTAVTMDVLVQLADD